MKDDDKKDEIGIMLPFLSDDGGDDSEPDPNGGFVIRRMKPKTAADYASDEKFGEQMSTLRARRTRCVLNRCREQGCSGGVEWRENEYNEHGPAEFYGYCNACGVEADATKYPLQQFWSWYKQAAEDTLDEDGDEPDITREYRRTASKAEAEIQAWFKRNTKAIEAWLEANPL